MNDDLFFECERTLWYLLLHAVLAKVSGDFVGAVHTVPPHTNNGGDSTAVAAKSNMTRFGLHVNLDDIIFVSVCLRVLINNAINMYYMYIVQLEPRYNEVFWDS